MARRELIRERAQVAAEDRLIEELTTCAGSLGLRASLALQRGRHDEAEALWREQLERIPDDLEAMEALVEIAVAQQKWDDAIGWHQRMLELAVKHGCEREQFGVPIGSFQAVKHMLADVAVRLEYARTTVARAAHSVARGARTRAVDASMAKLLACESATDAAKTALQVHGAIGYTWEHDLHLWMRRAWSLALEWGDAAWHRARLADAVIDGAQPAESFGYSAPGA